MALKTDHPGGGGDGTLVIFTGLFTGASPANRPALWSPLDSAHNYADNYRLQRTALMIITALLLAIILFGAGGGTCVPLL